MKKTTVFRKGIKPKKINLLSKSGFRNESDAKLAKCFDINFKTLKEIQANIEKRKEEHVKFDKANKTKTFFPSSLYLESFLSDYKDLPTDLRVKNIIIFDFETTGQFNSMAVSMAIELYDLEEEEVIDKLYIPINPNGIKIEVGAYNVHKIIDSSTMEKNDFIQFMNINEKLNKAQKDALMNSSKEELLEIFMDKYPPLHDVANSPTFIESYDKIYEILSKADMFVGQNLKFDLAVLERELERADLINKFGATPVFDTMEAGRGIVPSFTKTGRIKAPNLGEQAVHFGLVDCIEDAVFHNAAVDVHFTTKIFQALLDEF